MSKMMKVVMVVGIIGAIFTTMLGMKWSSDYQDNKVVIERLEKASKTLKIENPALEELKSLNRASYILMLGGFLSLIASIMVFKLYKISGIVMLATVLLAMVFAPKSLIATFLLLISGGLSLRLEKNE